MPVVCYRILISFFNQMIKTFFFDSRQQITDFFLKKKIENFQRKLIRTDFCFVKSTNNV